jgi:hypothetical protein
VQEKNGRQWAQLPARPQIESGQVLREPDGKVKYAKILEFTDKQAGFDWSDAVVAAVAR